MPTLKVILALLFLTGAQGRYFWQHDDPQQTPLQHLQEVCQVYVDSAKAAVKQAMAQFDSSTMGQELNLNLEEKLEATLIVWKEIRKQITPELEEIKTDLVTMWQNMEEEVTKDVNSIKTKIQPVVSKFREEIQQEVVKYFQEMVSISQELHQVAQEKLTPMVADLRDNIRTHVDNLRKGVDPHVKDFEQLIQKKMDMLQQKAVSEITQLKMALQLQLSDLHEKWQKMQEDWRSVLEESNWRNLFALLKAAEQEMEQQSS